MGLRAKSESLYQVKALVKLCWGLSSRRGLWSLIGIAFNREQNTSGFELKAVEVVGNFSSIFFTGSSRLVSTDILQISVCSYKSVI